MTRYLLTGLVALMLALLAALGWLLKEDITPNSAWRIGLTNWPGFDYFYLAEKKGFFREAGLDIEWVPVNSLTDLLLAYERGLLDGYTGTEIDVAHTLLFTQAPSRIVLLADYSTGGDMILATGGITTLPQLAGKRVGAEITSSFGRYMLTRALESVSMTLADIKVVLYSQAELVPAMARDEIDAALTYMPYAGKMMAAQPLHKIFDSSQLAAEVVDCVAVSPQVLQKDPGFSRRLQRVWQRALVYHEEHRDEVDKLFADRYGITVPAYRAQLGGTRILSVADMQNLARGNSLQTTMYRVASVIGEGKTLDPAKVSGTVAIWQGL